ncbi:hypothetical protein V8C86DRAFT_3106728 [Haematococcus lacustris]
MSPSAAALFLELSLIATAMVKRCRHSDASADGVGTTLGPIPGTLLLDLPALLHDIASRAALLGAAKALSLTCRAFSKTNLLHAPSLHIQLDSQGCYQFLTPRVVAALKARTCKLALTLEEQRSESSRQHIKLLTEALRKLANCATLQQLDLSSTFITQPKRPKPGAATPANLFYGVRLQQLSLLVTKKAVGEDKPFLPDLRPLSQHLTQLCLQQREGVKWHLDKYTAVLQPLAQLQVLTVSHTYHLQGLPGLLQALPRLHTLQLPHVGQDQLDALLAATQLTSIQLGSLEGLISSRGDAPCSWKRLGLTGSVDCSSAAHLPLHSLTQPLVLGALQCNANDLDLVAAAVNNLTQACKVPVMIKVLRLRMFVMPDTPAMAAQQLVELQQLMAVLQARKHYSWGMVSVTHMIVGAADVSTLAPFCQGCSHLQFKYGSLTPSLEFWRQLVQHMPTVTHLTFSDVKGSSSADMHQSLKLMADQPWARWLDIYISRYSDPEAPSATLEPRPGISLLDLPAPLLDDVARWAIQLGAGGTLSLTCRAFFKTNLLHAPALHIQLDSQRCDQLLTPRVVAALQARTCQLALSLEQPQAQSSREYIRLLTEVLKKLASCAAVEACRLAFIQDPSHAPHMPLDCSRSLAQHLMDTFPGLTSLSLDKYAIPCSGLATLLSHPQLSLQLQQLDLSKTTITQAERPKPGAATLANMFLAFRLKQLSLSTQKMAGETEPLLPDLRPLSQHLTQLCLQQCGCVGCGLDKFTAILQPLTRLQVLTISQTYFLEGLPRLLRALPHLHTLQLPDATVYGQEQLDSLLAATQLSSIQLNSLMGLTSSRADVPCSWQRLELTGDIGCSSAAHLPLQSLTQPLVLGELRTDYDNCKQGCTKLEFAYSSLTPSLEFWRQLMQHMPTITHLTFSKPPYKRLDCSRSLAQCLMGSFPALTSLALHGYSIPCSGLASLLSHPQLSLQLQQLDLTGITILQAKRPEPGAATLANLFHASRLKQLSLLINNMDGEGNNHLPNLQPLSQHLTQLYITLPGGVVWRFDEFTAALQPLAQLRVLRISQFGDHPGGLPSLLQELPRLHTLQLPDAVVKGQEQLDALLAATQLTSIQLRSLERLTSSRADVPCSWQRLELTGRVDCATAAYLPLHSLTQPLLLDVLEFGDEGMGGGEDANDGDPGFQMAAVHNLTQACKIDNPDNSADNPTASMTVPDLTGLLFPTDLRLAWDGSATLAHDPDARHVVLTQCLAPCNPLNCSLPTCLVEPLLPSPLPTLTLAHPAG